MDRFTISLDEDLAAAFDDLIARRGYRNRSEAVRDILRAELERNRQARDDAPHCIASLSYVYNHHERELAERLTGIQHHHHDLTVATLHAHLDHDNCIESVILKGPSAEVRGFADALMAERGVRHGALNLISVDVAEPPRVDGPAGHSHPNGHLHDHPHAGDPARPHFHYRPKT